MNSRSTNVVLAGLVTVTALARPNDAGAAELKVLCSNGIKAVMEELVPRFEQATRHTVTIRYGLSAALKRQIEAGEPFDVAVLTPPLIDDLIKQGRIAGDTRVTLARSGMALAIRTFARPARSSVRCSPRSPSATLGKARAACFSPISSGGSNSWKP
jgi:molybdate transport system substrate-binding protein